MKPLQAFLRWTTISVQEQYTEVLKYSATPSNSLRHSLPYCALMEYMIQLIVVKELHNTEHLKVMSLHEILLSPNNHQCALIYFFAEQSRGGWLADYRHYTTDHSVMPEIKAQSKHTRLLTHTHQRPNSRFETCRKIIICPKKKKKSSSVLCQYNYFTALSWVWAFLVWKCKYQTSDFNHVGYFWSQIS